MTDIGQSAPILDGNINPLIHPADDPPNRWKDSRAVASLRGAGPSGEKPSPVLHRRLGKAICESYGQSLANPSENLPITGDTANYVTFSTPEISYRQHPNFLYETLDEMNEIIEMDEQFPEIRLHLIQKPYRSDDDYFIIQSKNIPYDRAFDDLFQRQDYRPVPKFEKYIKILHGHLNQKVQKLFDDSTIKFKRTSDFYTKYAHYTISEVSSSIPEDSENQLRQSFMADVVAYQGCQEMTDWVKMPFNPFSANKDSSSKKSLIYVRTALRPTFDGYVVDFSMLRGNYLATVLHADERCLRCKRVGHTIGLCRNSRYNLSGYKYYRVLEGKPPKAPPNYEEMKKYFCPHSRK